MAVAILLWQDPAGALIVYQGQIVPAWPNIQGPSLAVSALSGRLNAPGTNFFPRPTGTVKGLTLLVDFSDQSGTFSVEEVSDWLNLEGYSRFGCNGSVHDFYYDVSNGIVDLQNAVRDYYRATNPKSYYEASSSYDRAAQLVQELLTAVDTDVDFSEYDNDGDGTAEAINIVYAGPSVTWGQGLWPHSGWIGRTFDGVTLGRYQMTNMGDSLGLYVFVHETGHMLFGWPDLYGFGDYCVMGNFSSDTNPVAVNDFFRADQGWIPLVDITAATNATLAAPSSATGYRFVNPAKPNELFFWSNVQNTGRWDYLQGSGLLALHYDGSIDGNSPPDPLELAVVQADGDKQLDGTMWPSPGSDTNDYFRAGTKDEWSTDTSPSSNWNDGSESGLRVYAIGETGPTMQFSVGDGSAGGSPSTGGVTSGGGEAGGGTPESGGAFGVGGTESGGGTPDSGGTPSSGGTEDGGRLESSGGITSGGGAPTTGGSSAAAGASPEGGTPAGGQASGGSMGRGGTAPSAGSGSGGLAAGGGASAAGGDPGSGGTAPVAGAHSTGGEVNGGAAAVMGGGTSAVGGVNSAGATTAEPGDVSGDEASGCSCRTSRDFAVGTRQPALWVLGLLVGLLPWRRYRGDSVRRRNSRGGNGHRARTPIAPEPIGPTLQSRSNV